MEILLAADIHTGSAEFDEKRWELFEELLKKPNVYVIFAGDQMEYATRQSKSDVYTQTGDCNVKLYFASHFDDNKGEDI